MRTDIRSPVSGPECANHCSGMWLGNAKARQGMGSPYHEGHSDEKIIEALKCA